MTEIMSIILLDKPLSTKRPQKGIETAWKLARISIKYPTSAKVMLNLAIKISAITAINSVSSCPFGGENNH